MSVGGGLLEGLKDTWGAASGREEACGTAVVFRVVDLVLAALMKFIGYVVMSSGGYSRISPGSRGSGPQGSCSLHDKRPSSLDIKSMPSRCSTQ